ncbi:hypothetical protein BGW36DRAFT_354700 [Talaromyces proteolyticus]|uniref:Uncharacterized protein n=1 Tax=Talaromyces proteolyticus TaxID=1131652 RepID=A0AAD4L484_9EURO|nr:uncharacterized protein BGW36DRAFT_354700 [Talaromyces proteolyticus]KAH8703272.1 hypothetical protein BGW36DRAFT_354700 [Talaromyces proteolyticus]
MAATARFGGRALVDQESMTLFSGDRETARMNEIRSNIQYVRNRWGDHDEYTKLKNMIRHRILSKAQSLQTRKLIEKLLSGFNDWADINYQRPHSKSDDIDNERLAAIELYCSEEGYNLIFILMNNALRNPVESSDELLIAATLVEHLTIELYNLRLSNIGDTRYANYQGITYRGIAVTSELAQAYRSLADEEDISNRHFSVPLSFMSSSTDRKTMEHFAQKDLDKHPHLEPFEMTIHIYGLDHQLLQRYSQKYKSSVVTSICAMPVAQISEYAEKEILLRGPAFHVISMYTIQEQGRNVHRLEVVMLNSNRDHGSEHGSNDGDKQVQRQFFLQVILASRYEVCAELAKRYSAKDAEEYVKLARIARQRIEEADPNESTLSKLPQTNTSLDHVKEATRVTWLGCSFFRSYPRHYANLRLAWQNTITGGCWRDIIKLLQKDYSWKRVEWFNVAKLRNTEEEELEQDNGFTLLHKLAVRESPSELDFEERSAWRQVIQELTGSGAWRSLRTFDDSSKTALEIAKENGRSELIDVLTPHIYHRTSEAVLKKLSSKLHRLMKEHAGTYTDILPQIDKHDFRMPQLSTLTELKKPEMWIPIPHMYGGFLIDLEVNILHVTIFKRVFGATHQEHLEYYLSGSEESL